jgi:proteasome lid subunit RPN8/RPN11
VRIARALYDELVAHALADAPNECCGMVAGRAGEATAVHRVSNVAQVKPFQYSMDPAEQHRVFTEIEDGGDDLIAIYHSHTRAGAYFSETDLNLAFMDDQPAWPGVVYIVVGLKDSDKGPKGVKGFLVDDGTARETPIEIV